MSKSHLSSQICHDIRNYVFGISGVSKIILSNKSKEEIEQNEDLKLIRVISEQSDQISALFNELLDLENKKNSSFNLNRVQSGNINDLINKAIIANQYSADQNNIQITSDLATDLPELEYDMVRMNQILINVISNAVKYSLKNSTVKISSKLVEDKVCIEILDNGIGMSEDEISYALSGNGKEIDKSALDREVQSCGFGLPIIKNLVELHQGELEISSQKGVGTCVKLWFKTPKPAKTSQTKSILIVEDNQVSAFIIKYILNKEGYTTYHAENGMAAIEMLDQNPDIDLVITDGQMPIMNGYETVKAIREGKSFKNFTNFNIPIIALAGINKEETSQESDSVINGSYQKSSSKTKLLEMVRSHL